MEQDLKLYQSLPISSNDENLERDETVDSFQGDDSPPYKSYETLTMLLIG